MSAAISLEGISKRFRIPLDRSTTLKYRVTHLASSSRYRELHALEDVTFDVPHGQFLGIVGHNGSGKSTLLKILSKIYAPDAGCMTIDGRVSPFLELGVGFNPELTARENVFLNGAILGLTRAEVHERIDEIIGFAELEDFADQKLKNFSSGMQVRLAFSVAIQAEAGILLMDEVLAVGDARFQLKCFEVFARYKREGRTVVLVTHDLVAVESYCDRAIVIDHGRVARDGKPADVTAHYLRLMGLEPDRITEGITATNVRPCTGQIVITGVRLLDGDGQERETYVTGDPLIVEVRFEVLEEVDQLACAVAISRGDGLNVSDHSSRVDGTELRCPPHGGTGVIRYIVDSLPLLGGTYELSVSLEDFDGARTYDRHERAEGFRVVDQLGREGVFALRGSWTVAQESGGPRRLNRTATGRR